MKIREFQFITPIRNVPSILTHGILSYEAASRLPHDSVAMPEIQDRRDRVRIPGGRMLHQYANLYFHARNPMLYKRKAEAHSLCVLRISVRCRHIEGAVIADRNASSDYVRFLSVDQVSELNLKAIYAQDWRHPNDPIAYFRHKSQKCAEFLIPDRLPPEYIKGAYTINRAATSELSSVAPTLTISIEPDLFFE